MEKFFNSLKKFYRIGYYSQFYQHFMSTFCTYILLSNNYKAKLLLEKICTKHFHTKKNVLMKCWWNWHQDSISSTFSRTFFVQKFVLVAFSSYIHVLHATRKSCQNDVCLKNSYIKILMKSTPGWTKEWKLGFDLWS